MVAAAIGGAGGRKAVDDGAALMVGCPWQRTVQRRLGEEQQIAREKRRLHDIVVQLVASILTPDSLLGLHLQIEHLPHLRLGVLELHLLDLLDDVSAVCLVDVHLDLAGHPPLRIPLFLDLELLVLLLRLEALVHHDLAAAARILAVLHKLLEDQCRLQQTVLLELQVHL